VGFILETFFGVTNKGNVEKKTAECGRQSGMKG
jgi:hypothetical protein